jgi:hypothetical protein
LKDTYQVSVGDEFYLDGQTDMTKTNTRYSKFCERPLKW